MHELITLCLPCNHYGSRKYLEYWDPENSAFESNRDLENGDLESNRDLDNVITFPRIMHPPNPTATYSQALPDPHSYPPHTPPPTRFDKLLD